MTTDLLHEFLVLAETLSYTKASQYLYVSQSVLSKHIKSLERELGVTLFSRTSHGVALTPSGKIFAQNAGILKDQCTEAFKTMQLQNRITRGTISLGMTVEFSYANHIQLFCRQFQEKYPDVTLRISVIPEKSTSKTLLEYDVFFSPCNYQLLPPNIEKIYVHSIRTYAALYPGHRLMTKTLLQLRDFEGETIIVPYAPEQTNPYYTNSMLIEKYTHGNVTRVSAPNISTALFYMSCGKGITIIPHYLKNLLPQHSAFVAIGNENCLFHEFLYINSDNQSADQFALEFRSKLII